METADGKFPAITHESLTSPSLLLLSVRLSALPSVCQSDSSKLLTDPDCARLAHALRAEIRRAAAAAALLMLLKTHI